MKKISLIPFLVLGFAVAGCSSNDKMAAADEQKMKDGFQHPPKLSDLPPDEQKRIQGMIDAHRTPPSSGKK